MAGSDDKPGLKDVCNSPETLFDYLTRKAGNHLSYKKYTTLKQLNEWVRDNSFFLSYGDNWNDLRDRDSFNQEGSAQAHFGTCFSFMKNENVAMWMLYGGTDNDGIMIDLSRENMRFITQNATNAEYGYWDDNRKFRRVGTLQQGDFSLQRVDMLYYAESKIGDQYYYITRSDEVYKEASRAVIDKLQWVLKSNSWNYERECRLVLSSEKEHFTDGYFQRKGKAIRLIIPSLYEKLEEEGRIYTSPNFSNKNKSRDYTPSVLTNTMNWDLCSGCKLK